MVQLSQMLGGTGANAGGAVPTWPPPGAFGGDVGTEQRAAGEGANADPLAGLGGLDGLGGLGGLGALGGLGNLQQLLGASPSQATTNGPPPEERYATQLEQLQNMGFTDARANLRALLMSGGSVEAALGILLD